MHHLAFLQDLAIIMIVAGFVTILCHRFKQPVVLGYIVAGLIIGPHTPPYGLIHDKGTIQILSELGVIFLMFSLGLEFSLRKLRAVGSTAFIAASLEIILLMFVGYQVGKFFDWKPMDSLFLGAILAISSTTIIMKAFSEMKLGKQKFAGLVFGILIVEDMLGIVLIALLTGIAKTGTLQGVEAAITIGELVVFLVVSLVVGLIFVPRLISFVSRFASPEMLLITVLGLCFGFTLITVKLEYSVALGAFLIGAILAEAKELGKIESLMFPIRDMFSAVFFVSVGLLINPSLIWEHILPITVISVAVIVGKVISCGVGTYLAGHDIPTSTRVGMSLSQIGEFSFIIAATGLTLGVTSDFLYPIAVSVSAITTLTTPYLIRASDPFAGWLVRTAPSTAVSYANLYTRWYGQFHRQRQNSQVRKILRRIMGQLAIFLGLIAGSLLSAVFLSRVLLRVVPQIRIWEDLVKSLLWLIAIVAVLPVYIAAIRKLRALGMILAELGLPDKGDDQRKTELRAVVANAFWAFTLLLLAGFTFGLSYAALPSAYVVVALVLVVGVLAWFLRDSFNKIYFQGKAALSETFSGPVHEPSHRDGDPVSMSAEESLAVSLVSKEGQLETFVVGADMPCASRTIREMALRTQTGALIVGIKREGRDPLVNPSVEEQLHTGDKVIMFGTAGQLEDAVQLLSGGSEHATGV
jgi:CPA2 family monovalent cation:H+ antiporter-2